MALLHLAEAQQGRVKGVRGTFGDNIYIKS
jgi:hypothetical protein